MNEKKIDPKTLSGEALFWYYTENEDYHDEDYSSVVKLLTYATESPEEAYKILEECVKNDKKLVAIYPGEGEAPTEGMTFVGSIIDGALYME